ncbi:hypothetical protein HK103_006108 [Boothiomyces macroporosus]|uniref:Uncharacterized protein n=1 Tax=Boothiomyces macroporosus TaxID=261099 RepID=A0AAD5Y2D0_9FUNG|nr:hypothetical protein HK103_006108 [Boothiomyces macroporosus]
MSNTSINSYYLFDICDYRANYLGCDPVKQYSFAIVDLVIIIMTCVSILAFAGLVVRNLLSKKTDGKKWTAADTLCVLCGLSNIFRIVEIANVRSVVFKDQSAMTDFQAKQYFQITVFIDFLYFGSGAVASNVFLVSVAGAAAGVNVFADIKVGDKVLSPDKILKIVRLVILILTLSFCISWATIGATTDLESYITYRRCVFILAICTIVFVSLPVILFFGNNVLRILSEAKSSKSGSVKHVSDNAKNKSVDNRPPSQIVSRTVEGSQHSEISHTKSVKKTGLTQEQKISNFRLAINMCIWILYVSTILNHILLLVGFEVPFFQENTVAAVILKAISDTQVWVCCGFMFIYLFRVG